MAYGLNETRGRLQNRYSARSPVGLLELLDMPHVRSSSDTSAALILSCRSGISGDIGGDLVDERNNHRRSDMTRQHLLAVGLCASSYPSDGSRTSPTLWTSTLT